LSPIQLASLHAAAQFLREAVEAEPVAHSHNHADKDERYLSYYNERMLKFEGDVFLFTSQLEGE
jgi:hypothetical protein